MGRAPDTTIEAEELLRRLGQHKRLVSIVTALVREVERLQEENLQLRAAVSIYRDLTPRCQSNTTEEPVRPSRRS